MFLREGEALPDEAIGLASGLLAAGARAVIAALWPIPDLLSAMLIYRFHAEWRQGSLGPAEALRSSQQWMRDSTNGEKYDYFLREAISENGHARGAAATFVGALAFLQSSSRDWRFVSLARSASSLSHGISGWRRMVPVARHGASSRIASNGSLSQSVASARTTLASKPRR